MALSYVYSGNLYERNLINVEDFQKSGTVIIPRKRVLLLKTLALVIYTEINVSIWCSFCIWFHTEN